MFGDYLFIMIEYCNVDINSLECKVLLLVKAAQRSAGIIASNSAPPSSGSPRIIGQLDLFSPRIIGGLFNRRIIGQKIMGANGLLNTKQLANGGKPGITGQRELRLLTTSTMVSINCKQRPNMVGKK